MLNKKNMVLLTMMAASLALASFMACKKDDIATAPVTNAVLPDVFKKFNATVILSTDGSYVIIKTKGIPDHKSPYFSSTDARCEAYNGTNANFQLNPNRIVEQSLTYKIPLNPVAASNKQATPLGPMGVSLNGVPLFNQYAGPAQPLTVEINSFDQYNGHPQQSGQYHYHIEPLFMTAQNGKASLIGFLLDGYPVYGPAENGVILTSNNLDAYHGHSGITADYPNGIYHYHITEDAPYINGNSFWGTPGTVTQ